jgi:hypothetical protein
MSNVFELEKFDGDHVDDSMGRRYCEGCGEPTYELFESPDLLHVCEGCLNGVDEEFTYEMEDCDD